jgi:hypothetical protein
MLLTRMVILDLFWVDCEQAFSIYYTAIHRDEMMGLKNLADGFKDPEIKHGCRNVPHGHTEKYQIFNQLLHEHWVGCVDGGDARISTG